MSNALRRLTEDQKYEVVRHRDRMLFAAMEQGFDPKEAAELADMAAEKKAKELAVGA